MQKMAMIRTFKAVMKTHYIANGIFSLISAPFLEIQKYSLSMYHRKERGGEKGKEEKKKA